MSAARTAVRRFATSARLRNKQGEVYTPKSEPQPVPAQTQQPYTTAPASQPAQAAPKQQVGTAGNVPVEKPVGGLR